jgi:hypothetical protein
MINGGPLTQAQTAEAVWVEKHQALKPENRGSLGQN